ncbi:uncharacterized protein BXZ73DRAFT_104300 [Epithele typhae]|uniref:uncharacterized protein n=1 Tax=Epithele typhae TaxID=378194 RepID=UPI0020075667|nr:uncharacterized protein BXZ73DRAFT_104300 [Epithele typhae]KAH9921681.1 hypothetical protein BXZ73DRAFT_104300 [Epithele typhae]
MLPTDDDRPATTKNNNTRTRTTMGRSKRESRRPFGRPKTPPGPQETFEGSFQINPAQTPEPGSSHHAPSPAPPAAVQRSISAPVRVEERRASQGSASRPALVGRIEVERAEAAPSRAARPPHRPSNSHPSMPTMLAAGGDFSNRRRSNSSTVLSGLASVNGVPGSWPSPQGRHAQGFSGSLHWGGVGGDTLLSPVSYTPGTNSSGSMSVGRGGTGYGGLPSPTQSSLTRLTYSGSSRSRCRSTTTVDTALENARH